MDASAISRVFAIPPPIIGRGPNWNSHVERGDYLLAMSETAGFPLSEDPAVVDALWRRLERTLGRALRH